MEARTGRVTADGSKAKEKMYPSRSDGNDELEATPCRMKKIRKCPPRCIVCCATADGKNKDIKIRQTTMYCSTCLVYLCVRKIGNRRTTCFERFHHIQHLSDLKSKHNLPKENTFSSKKHKPIDSVLI